VATAPTPALAHGTAVPTEKYLDWTATPRFLVFGSKATMEKVEASRAVLTRNFFCVSIQAYSQVFSFMFFLGRKFGKLISC
jgi:hypothetical protein